MNDHGHALLVFPFLFMIVGVVIGLVSTVIWVLALVDAIKNPRLTDNERIIWVIVILFTQCLGALLYYIVGRKK
jgi:hypothetical protein